MQSNSKLTTTQKLYFKNLKAAHSDIKFAVDGKTTFAFKRKGNLMEFATAICSDNEKKNRLKVGQYYAISRFNWGCTVKLPDFLFDGLKNNNSHSGNFG